MVHSENTNEVDTEDVKLMNYGTRFAEAAAQQQPFRQRNSNTAINQHRDIWAAGQVCYHMVIGEKPFTTTRESEKSRLVLGSSSLQTAFSSPQWGSVATDAQDFITCLMSAQVDSVTGNDITCSAGLLLLHPWLLEAGGRPVLRRRSFSNVLGSPKKQSPKCIDPKVFQRKSSIMMRDGTATRHLSDAQLNAEKDRVTKHTAAKLPSHAEKVSARESRFWNDPSPNDIDMFFANRRSLVSCR